MVAKIITTKKVTLICTFLTTMVLLIGSLVVYVKATWPPEKIQQYHLKYVNEKFDLDEENNVPTYFEGASLLFGSLLLLLISWAKKQTRDRFVWNWRVLSLIFLFLSLDEIASIHEMSVDIVRDGFHTRSFFYFAWVIPGMVAVLLLTVLYLRFWWNLPARTRWLFAAAGGIFLGGAVGMEMVGGYLLDQFTIHSVQYVTGTILEEALEMFGILLFIYTLMDYLEKYVGGIQLHFGTPQRAQSEIARAVSQAPVSALTQAR